MLGASCASAYGPPLRASKIVPDNFVVRRVEQLFAYAEQIEQRVKDAQARVNHLTQSILAKAFDSRIPALGALPQPLVVQIRSGRICRGQLTADWRAQNPDLISGENSAAALLQKIKTEREATAKPKRKLKA